MKQECPQCRTVTVANFPYCQPCGYRFRRADPVREMVSKLSKPKKHHGAAALVGFAVAIVQYFAFRR